jgi:hypothetical protein
MAGGGGAQGLGNQGMGGMGSQGGMGNQGGMGGGMFGGGYGGGAQNQGMFGGMGQQGGFGPDINNFGGGMGSGMGQQGGFNPFGGGPAPSYMTTTSADMGFGQRGGMGGMFGGGMGGFGGRGGFGGFGGMGGGFNPYARQQQSQQPTQGGSMLPDMSQYSGAPVQGGFGQQGGMGALLAQQMQQRGMAQPGGDMGGLLRGYGSPTELYAGGPQNQGMGNQQPQQGQMSFDEFKNSGRIQDQAYRTPEQQIQRDQEDYQKYLSSPRQMGGNPQQQLGFDAGMGGNMRQGQIPQYAMGALANMFNSGQTFNPYAQQSGGLGSLRGLLGGAQYMFNKGGKVDE